MFFSWLFVVTNCGQVDSPELTLLQRAIETHFYKPNQTIYCAPFRTIPTTRHYSCTALSRYCRYNPLTVGPSLDERSEPDTRSNFGAVLDHVVVWALEYVWYQLFRSWREITSFCCMLWQCQHMGTTLWFHFRKGTQGIQKWTDPVGWWLSRRQCMAPWTRLQNSVASLCFKVFCYTLFWKTAHEGAGLDDREG